MLSGSCLCESVKYHIHGEPISMYYCFCSMCRRASGSSHAVNMLVFEKDFVVVTGAEFIKEFESSSNEWRCFCSKCGTPIYARATVREGLISVRCGTLLQAPQLRPNKAYFVEDKATWLELQEQAEAIDE